MIGIPAALRPRVAAPLALTILAFTPMFATSAPAAAQGAGFCADLLHVVGAVPQGFTGLSTEAMPGADICGVTQFGLTSRPAFECKWSVGSPDGKSAAVWFAQRVGGCVPGWRYQSNYNFSQGAEATFESAAAEIVVTEPARNEVSVTVVPPPR